MNKKTCRLACLTVVIVVLFCTFGCKKKTPEDIQNTIATETATNTEYMESTPTTEAAELGDVTVETTEELIILGTEESELTENPKKNESNAKENKKEEKDSVEAETKVEETVEPPMVELPEEPVIEGETSFEQYNAMSGSEQAEFMESFESADAFFEWYAVAKAEYDANKKDIEISGNEVIVAGK